MKSKKQNTTGTSPKTPIPRAIFLILLVLIIGGMSWEYQRTTHEINKLEKQRLYAVVCEGLADQRKKEALLCASAAGELQGWKGSLPRVSNLVSGLIKLPDGLVVSDLMMERNFVIKTVDADDIGGGGHPLPISALHLSDVAFLEIVETEKGKGLRAFPRFLAQIEQKTTFPIEYTRDPLEMKWSEAGSEYDFIEGRSRWSLSMKFPQVPLWKGILE